MVLPKPRAEVGHKQPSARNRSHADRAKRVALPGRRPHDGLVRLVGAPQRSGSIRLRLCADARIIRALAEGAHDSARMTEIPLMSSLFISTID